MEIRRENKYKRIAERLIANVPELAYIKDSQVRVAYLESNEEKKKDRRYVFGDCAKVNTRYSWCCPYDFMITIYKPNIENFDFNRTQIEALMLHELLHIGIDNDGNEPSYYVEPHDVEDFYAVWNKYGQHWQMGE